MLISLLFNKYAHYLLITYKYFILYNYLKYLIFINFKKFIVTFNIYKINFYKTLLL